MQTIRNKTKRPISVPLPRGKRLFLGPGRTGQIASRDVGHPPLVALVEAGEVEILGEGSSFAGRGRGDGPSASPGQGHNPDKSVFRSGDG